MKEKTLGWPLRILSYLYLAVMPISVLGTIFSSVDMLYLAAFGPKSFFYMLMYGLFGGYFGEMSTSTVRLCVGVSAVMFAVILGFSIYAHVKRKYFILFMIAVADIALYSLLCLLLDLEMTWFVVPNILYSICLALYLFKRRNIEDEIFSVEGDI